LIHVRLKAIPAGLMVAVLLGVVAADGNQAQATDVAAVRQFLRADKQLLTTLAMNFPSGRRRVGGVVSVTREECPKVLAGAARESGGKTVAALSSINEELLGAFMVAVYAIDSGASRRYAKAVDALR
jgi:hypothetical protein